MDWSTKETYFIQPDTDKKWKSSRKHPVMDKHTKKKITMIAVDIEKTRV